VCYQEPQPIMVIDATRDLDNLPFQSHTFYLGDCIKVMKRFPSESIDLVYADPPYNLSKHGLKWADNDGPNRRKSGGNYYMMKEAWDMFPESDYRRFSVEWLKEAERLLKPGGSIYVSCTYHNVGDLLVILRELELKCLNIIVWEKTNPHPNLTRRMFTHSCEFVLFFAKGKNWAFNYEEMKRLSKNGRQMKDVWRFPLCQGFERIKGENGRAAHPTQKPTALLERIILASSKQGDLVLDPFSGTGTTAFVAERFCRKWIGIDNNTNYISLSVERLNNVQVALGKEDNP
jgi:site-specific DNA-methyltransferase (adenine-specific)